MPRKTNREQTKKGKEISATRGAKISCLNASIAIKPTATATTKTKKLLTQCAMHKIKQTTATTTKATTTATTINQKTATTGGKAVRVPHAAPSPSH